MYHSTSTYISKNINTDTVDIIQQIKKQAEEISTSEGSFNLFSNLSNPTNLTNPQIIGIHKTAINNYQTPTFQKKDLTKIKKRNIYKSKSNADIIKEELQKGQKLSKFFNNKYEEEKTSIKNSKKIIINDNFEEKDCKTTKGKIILEPIWEKIQKIDLSQRKKGDIRINVRKEALINKFIDNSKKISQIKYDIDIKKEKYKQIKNIKESQILLINKTEQKISLLLNGILNDYNTNYVQYIKFLNKTLEVETQKSYDLNTKLFNLKNNINSINNQIYKLIETKFKIFKWIELLIKLKEKIKIVPKYYFDILERNDNYQIYKYKEKIIQSSPYFMNDYTFLLNKNNNNNLEIKLKEIAINENKKEKILNYKYNLIFKDPEEFMYQYTKIENHWLKYLDKYNSLIKEIYKLKQKLNEIDEPNFKEDEKLLIEKLKLNKNIYKQLKYQYELLKGQNIKKIKRIKLDNNSDIKSSFSSTQINNTIYNEMVNNLHFYNIKTLSSNKKKNSASSEFFDLLNTNLYKLIFDLLDLANQNNFIKFDKTSFIKNRNTNPIFEIMNYIELVINLLLEEKYKYLNDPKLSKKYKELQASFANDSKRMKILKLMKFEEVKRSIKLKTMEEKRKRQYFSSKKIDQSLYKKLKMIKLNKIEEKKASKQKEEKNELNIKEFLYDLK